MDLINIYRQLALLTNSNMDDWERISRYCFIDRSSELKATISFYQSEMFIDFS